MIEPTPQDSMDLGVVVLVLEALQSIARRQCRVRQGRPERTLGVGFGESRFEGKPPGHGQGSQVRVVFVDPQPEHIGLEAV